MTETIYLLQRTKFNGDFNITDEVGTFTTYALAERAVESMKDLNCNAFAEFRIKPVRLFSEWE